MLLHYTGMNNCTGGHRPPPASLLIERSPCFLEQCVIFLTFSLNYTSYIKLPHAVDSLLRFRAAATSQFLTLTTDSATLLIIQDSVSPMF